MHRKSNATWLDCILYLAHHLCDLGISTGKSVHGNVYRGMRDSINQEYSYHSDIICQQIYIINCVNAVAKLNIKS